MALTEQQQTDIYKMGVGLFQASPGTVYMNWFAGLLESGLTIDQLYEISAIDPTFQSQDFGFTNASTNEQFATAFVDHVTGDTLSAENREWAIDFVAGQLDAGMTRGQVMKLAIDALDAVPHDDANFGAAAARFDNQVEVAQHYTEELSGSALTLAALQNTVASVDETPESVEAAKAANAIDVGQPGTQTFTLVFGEDNLVGTSGDDVFNAPIVSDNDGSTVETLEDFDVIDGSAGNDTLNVTLDDDNNPSPNVQGVEIFNIRDVSGSFLGFENVTGVQQIFNRGSNDVTLFIGGVDSTDVLFGVADTEASTDIQFAEDTLEGTSDELKLDLNGASGGAIFVDDEDGNLVEAVSLNVTGENEADITGVGGDIEDLTITGAGSVELEVDATSLVNLDASTMTEGLDIDISGASSTELNVQTGAGDDRVLIDGTLLIEDNDEIVVDLGEGTNTLALANIASDVEIGDLVFTAATLTSVGAVELSNDLTLAADATIDFDPIEPGALVFSGNVTGPGFTLGLDNTATELAVTTEADVSLVTVDFLTAEVLTIDAEGDITGTALLGEELTSLTVNATESDTFIDLAFTGQGDADLDTLTSVTLNDTSDDGDVEFDLFLEDTTNVSTIALSGGEATDFDIDVSDAAFDGAVTVEIGDFGVDAEGEVEGFLFYFTDNTNGVRETFEFVGTNIGDVEIEGFLPGVGATADRLDFSGFEGIETLDDLAIEFDGANTVIEAGDGQFDGTITVIGVDLTTDQVNFVL